MKVVMVIPVYEDWESASLLCEMIDGAFKQTLHRVDILFIDDGSFTPPDDLAKLELGAVSEIAVLHLQRNLGHQRAIAIGLAWVEQNISADAVIVMDGDGEDLPEDIPALLERAAETRLNSVIFAERGKRMDGLVFRALYLCYRTAHRLLTGRGIRFGNFSVIPFRFLHRLTTMPELWGHYAAAVLNARIPYATVRVNRGRRLRGATKMNLEALILHGLAAVAVYQAVSVRVLIGSAALAAFFMLLAAVTAALHVRGWPGIAGICLLLTCIVAFNAVLYVFTSLSFRHLMGVLPARDYVYFVDRCARVYPVQKLQATSA